MVRLAPLDLTYFALTSNTIPRMWPFFVAAGVIVGVAGGLIAWHRSVWQKALAAKLPEGDGAVRVVDALEQSGP